MAKRNAAAKSATTISDVAEAAGVTATTVSMVMRNKPGISAPTRDRVLAAARELGYQPSATRQTRSPAYFGQVGLLLVSGQLPPTDDEPGGSYVGGMLEGCMAEAERLGSSLGVSRLTFEQIHDGQLPQAMARGQLDGVMVRGWILPELSQLLENTGLPAVFLDCDRHIDDATQVQIGNLRGMSQLVDHLVGAGARNVATITGDMDHLNAQERLAGLRMALERHGLALDQSRLVYEKGFLEASGERGAETLLSRGVSFDTLVCQNDLIAHGAMVALKQHGVNVPEDVRVTGFDNMRFARNAAIPLTTVDPQPRHLGEVATQLLMERIQDPDRRPLHVRIPAHVLVRRSTGKTEADPTAPEVDGVAGV